MAAELREQAERDAQQLAQRMVRLRELGTLWINHVSERKYCAMNMKGSTMKDWQVRKRDMKDYRARGRSSYDG